MKHIRGLLFIFSFLFLTVSISYAKDITIVYSGQTHAMLYPCSCPVKQDGGIARRASLIKELRKIDPALLLLDCGAFTAGGLMDEYTQEPQLDTKRTLINLKAMELMQYDAIGISSDEFNFGKEFFLEMSKTTNLVFLSANLELDKIVPYIIKDRLGVKIGIIGLTNVSANQKAKDIKIDEPKKIKELISRLKKDGVEVIVVLSTLGEKEDLKLISEVKGIDILFIGQNPLKDESFTKVDSTFMLRPSWQGRKLGKLILEINDGKLINCKTEEIIVSDKIADNADILSILPRCYSDTNCRKEGFIGSCKNMGNSDAECEFRQPNKISLRVISSKECTVCNVEPIVNEMKKKLPGITVEYFYYPDSAAVKIIEGLPISGLPVYIFGKELEKDENFYNIKDDFISTGDFYLLKPQIGGLSYFFNREKIENSLDLFFSMFEKDTDKLLSTIEEFKPNLHFLAVENVQGFDAKNGLLEVEEYLRAVCVQKYYPKEFLSYLICRSKNINSSYWDDCISKVDLSSIKACARGAEGVKLLKENISLSKELKIMFGPAYLLNNQEIFSSQGIPSKEEFRKITKKQ